ncbi:hypothetical protein NDA14_004175 [Ustilago hordei]|nr:hypothetical protein NDA14_004175 [Ustilago hordei]
MMDPDLNNKLDRLLTLLEAQLELTRQVSFNLDEQEDINYEKYASPTGPRYVKTKLDPYSRTRMDPYPLDQEEDSSIMAELNWSKPIATPFPKFNPQDMEIFILEAEAWFKFNQVYEQTRMINHMGAQLEGTAREWWTSKLHIDRAREGRLFNDWHYFTERLSEQFNPCNARMEAYNKLLALRLTSDAPGAATRHVERFRDLEGQVNLDDNELVIDLFRGSLTRSIQEKFERNPPGKRWEWYRENWVLVKSKFDPHPSTHSTLSSSITSTSNYTSNYTQPKLTPSSSTHPNLEARKPCSIRLWSPQQTPSRRPLTQEMATQAALRWVTPRPWTSAHTSNPWILITRRGMMMTTMREIGGKAVLELSGMVQDHPARILADTGAGFSASMQVSIGTHNLGVVEASVADTADYDLILGFTELRRLKPTIQWDTGQLEFKTQEQDRPPRRPPEAARAGDLTMRRPTLHGNEFVSAEHILQAALEDGPIGFMLLEEPPSSLPAFGFVPTGADKGVEMEVEVDKVVMAADIPKPYQHLRDVFDEVEADKLPHHTEHDLHLKLIEGGKPPQGPLYLKGPKEMSKLRRYLDENLKKGFIRPSKSPAQSPVLFVPKKDGGLRLCVDYRGLNEITVKNRAPLPLIEEQLFLLRKARIYTKLDLRAAYNLIWIAKGDEWKTAFGTQLGLYEYLVMPFGLANALAHFQSFINDIF